jgi:hypothetical protein
LHDLGGSLLDRIAAGGAGVTVAGSKYVVRYAKLVLAFASGPAAPHLEALCLAMLCTILEAACATVSLPAAGLES